MPEAARQGDPIGHSSAMAGLLVGIASGVVLAAAVVAIVGTGGVAAVAIGAGIAAAGASGGLAGEYIGEAIQSATGTIVTGSSDTDHEGKPAARAKLDVADCSRHGRNRIAEGSKTVAINGEPAARRGDHTECGAVIMAGAKSIMIGGPSIQVLPVRQEVPAWLHNSLIAVAIGGAIIATGGAATVFGIGPAVGGLVGSLSGGWSLGWVGGKIGQAVGEHFGDAELGKRIGEVSFGVIGSFAGGYLGARLGAKVLPADTVPKGGQASTRAVEDWADSSPKRPAVGQGAAHDFQVETCGPEETQVSGGGQQVWADGVEAENASLQEAKYVSNPDKSPFVDDSNIDPEIKQFIRSKTEDEFRRYAAVINDPTTPVSDLEVITNEPRAVSYFESLLAKFNIPGSVTVVK